MKKSVLVMALAIGTTAAFAQDLTSKKGEKFLPEANDWSIGMNAAPILNAIGSAVSNQNNGGGAVTGFMGATNYITGKMFKDEKTAYRAMLGINFGSTTQKALVNQAGSTSNPPAKVEDTKGTSAFGIDLGAGYEMRRGNTRLQGYYGGMVMIGFGTSSETYTYGNALSATNTSNAPQFSQAAGLKESKAGSTFSFGLNGFVGAEYFFLPKLSLGAEYWWGLGFTNTGEGESTSESWNGTGVTSTTTKNAGSSAFNLGGQYANLFINFHF